MLKALRVATVLVFVITLILFCVFYAKEQNIKDNTIPSIEIPSGILDVSIQDPQAYLLSGVVARDKKDGDLTGWADQGVLLLNAVLTVRAHQANSHKGKGWEYFTDSIIKKISDKKQGVVFLLWGANARSKKSLIDGRKHLILECAHPSPLSAYNGFFGSGHFIKTNEYLVKQGKTPIDWSK